MKDYSFVMYINQLTATHLLTGDVFGAAFVHAFQRYSLAYFHVKLNDKKEECFSVQCSRWPFLSLASTDLDYVHVTKVNLERKGVATSLTANWRFASTSKARFSNKILTSKNTSSFHY